MTLVDNDQESLVATVSDEYQQNKIEYRSIERSKELATRVASKKLR